MNKNDDKIDMIEESRRHLALDLACKSHSGLHEGTITDAAAEYLRFLRTGQALKEGDEA